MSAPQVCHSLLSFTSTIIPLLWVPRVEHEEYFGINLFVSCKYFYHVLLPTGAID